MLHISISLSFHAQGGKRLLLHYWLVQVNRNIGSPVNAGSCQRWPTCDKRGFLRLEWIITQCWYRLELRSLQVIMWMEITWANIIKRSSNILFVPAEFDWRASHCFYPPALRMEMTVVWLSHTYCSTHSARQHLNDSSNNLQICYQKHNPVITSHNIFHI